MESRRNFKATYLGRYLLQCHVYKARSTKETSQVHMMATLHILNIERAEPKLTFQMFLHFLATSASTMKINNMLIGISFAQIYTNPCVRCQDQSCFNRISSASVAFLPNLSIQQSAFEEFLVTPATSAQWMVGYQCKISMQSDSRMLPSLNTSTFNS